MLSYTETIIATLRDVVGSVQDMVTVYLAAAPASELRPAAHAETRWRALADRLREQGAEEPTLDAIWPPLRSAATARSGAAIFAHAGQVVYAQRLPGWTRGDLAAFGAPAHAVPLLGWLQTLVPYVVVVTDRTGADITGCYDSQHPLAPVRVDGPDDEIERNAPGGWSQPRYQRRAEDSWEHNAAAVAEETARVVRAVNARLVIVSGDVRAVQLLGKELSAPEHRDLTIEHLTGGRHADGSEDDRPARVAGVVREFVARQEAALLARFADLRGPSGLAVEGTTDTVAALAHGRVATLIVVAGFPVAAGLTVAAGQHEQPTAWFAPPPTAVALDPAEVFERHQAVRSGPLTDVAVRAALLTGADVHVLAPDSAGAPDGGLGALCRFQRA